METKVFLIRNLPTKKAVFGDLFFNRPDVKICSTLEDPDRDLYQTDTIEKILAAKKQFPKECAIPYGEYPLGWRWSPSLSPRFTGDEWKIFTEIFIVYAEGQSGLLLPHIQDIPCFDYVMFHTGNIPEHTEGCPITGLTKIPEQNRIVNSKPAFRNLISKLYAVRDSKTKLIITKGY